MVLVLSITTVMFVTELVVGYRTGSLALVNDSFNMISDILSLLIGFICLLVRKMKLCIFTQILYFYLIFKTEHYKVGYHLRSSPSSW